MRTEVKSEIRLIASDLIAQGMIIGSIVGVMWLLELIDILFLNQRLNLFGIRPRDTGYMWGIAFAPFLHGGISHLLANTPPFIALGWLVLARSRKEFLWVTIVVTLSSGLGAWLFGAYWGQWCYFWLFWLFARTGLFRPSIGFNRVIAHCRGHLWLFAVGGAAQSAQCVMARPFIWLFRWGFACTWHSPKAWQHKQTDLICLSIRCDVTPLLGGHFTPIFSRKHALSSRHHRVVQPVVGQTRVALNADVA